MACKKCDTPCNFIFINSKGEGGGWFGFRGDEE